MAHLSIHETDILAKALTLKLAIEKHRGAYKRLQARGLMKGRRITRDGQKALDSEFASAFDRKIINNIGEMVYDLRHIRTKNT